MPTLDEWERALATPRSVRIESSDVLIAEVHERHALRDYRLQQAGKPVPPRKTALTKVGQFAPERQIEVVPLHLLHRLGVVTTPPIQNLADICSTWAYFRYLWAFEIPPAGTLTPLRLSSDARSIDFHQKSLLSDQIGVGMAALLASECLGAPLAADVSLAVGDPTWPVKVDDGPSPDYLFFNETRSNIFVVECKGTQTSRWNALEQLRRGTEQVPAVTFTDGRPSPPALVVATCLSATGTEILVIDPPGDDNPERGEKPKRVGPRDWVVEKAESFDYTVSVLAQARLLSFAGADERAEVKLAGIDVPRKRIRRPLRQLHVEENTFGKFHGTSGQMGFRDGSAIDVFQGLDSEIYEALIQDEPARTAETLKRFREKESSMDLDGRQSVRTSMESDGLVVRSLAPDGSLLQVRVRS